MLSAQIARCAPRTEVFRQRALKVRHLPSQEDTANQLIRAEKTVAAETQPLIPSWAHIL